MGICCSLIVLKKVNDHSRFFIVTNYRVYSSILIYNENAICVLNEIRLNTHNESNLIFEESLKILNDLGCDINIARWIKQKKKKNIEINLYQVDTINFISGVLLKVYIHTIFGTQNNLCC